MHTANTKELPMPTARCRLNAFDKGGEKEIAKWLDCDEVEVKPCNYYGAYTIKLKA